MRKIILVFLLNSSVVAATTTDATLAQPCTALDQQAAATEPARPALAGKCRPAANAAMPDTETNTDSDIGSNTGANTGANTGVQTGLNVMPVDLATSVSRPSSTSTTASSSTTPAAPASPQTQGVQRVQHNSTLEWLGSSMLLILVGFWLWMTRK
jgi:hypothetical protein